MDEVVNDAMRIRYEIPEDEPPSRALVTVLAGLVGEAPTEIRPVGRLVDLEALDRFLDQPDPSAPCSASARFEFDGHVLTIDASEVVLVEEDESAGNRPSRGAPGRSSTAGGDGLAEDEVPGSEGAGSGDEGANFECREVDDHDAANVLLLAPSSSAVEARTCTELRPGGETFDSTVLEVSFGHAPTDLGKVGVDTVETLERWRRQHGRVGLCLDSVSTLVRQVGLDRTYRFLDLLSRRVSRLDVAAHYHADPNQHDLETTYTLETLADTVVVAGDGSITPTD